MSGIFHLGHWASSHQHGDGRRRLCSPKRGGSSASVKAMGTPATEFYPATRRSKQATSRKLMLQDVGPLFFWLHFSPFHVTLYTIHASTGWWKKLCFPYLLLEPEILSLKKVNKRKKFNFSFKEINFLTDVWIAAHLLEAKSVKAFPGAGLIHTAVTHRQICLGDENKSSPLSSGNTEEPPSDNWWCRPATMVVSPGSKQNTIKDRIWNCLFLD